MPSTSLSEIVYFELSDQALAQRMCIHLGTTRLAWTEPREGSHVVGVVLSSRGEDLALLLREVESWLAEAGAGTISFEIDDRAYLLRPRIAPSRAAA